MFANKREELMEHPENLMLGRSGKGWMIPDDSEMIPIPKGASLVAIPGHIPVGMDFEDKLTYFDTNPLASNEEVMAVAALLPQGFTRTFLPACTSKNGEPLGLLGYTAVAYKEGEIFVAAVQSDAHKKWHPQYYNTEGLSEKIHKKLKKLPDNRILRQLARCSLEYNCYTAQNIFYERWEGGIPTMNKCNADCIGCISESHQRDISQQNRLDFIPSVNEIAELGLEHLANAREAIISFGQGCEGDPSLNAKDLSAAIRLIRKQSERGTININTNAGYTEGIKMLSEAGLNAIRVSLFSCQEENYLKYHRPRNYSLDDVVKSIHLAKDQAVKISLNLLVFPGFTDREDEIEALIKFINKNSIDIVQLRNLNMDPEQLFKIFPAGSEALGIKTCIDIIQEECKVKIASYTHPH